MDGATVHLGDPGLLVTPTCTTNPCSATGLTDSNGFLVVVPSSASSAVSYRVYAGPVTADQLQAKGTVGSVSVPLPVGWAWEVVMYNHSSSWDVRWTPLTP